MKKISEDIGRLNNLKTGDEIWSCHLSPVFSTNDGYFGHYFWGNDYDPWEIHCIEGKSPTVFKPMKLFYEGRFDADSSGYGKLFVFATSLEPTSFNSDRYVLPFYYDGYKPPRKLELDAKMFDSIVDPKRLLRFERVEFTREECLKKCRELNSSWHWCSGIGAYGKWYMKTINKMKKELSECMKAEWVVDPEVQIKKTLNGEDNG
jgi:hypothetical protein